MDESAIGVADVHRLVGRSSAAAPDPAAFTAARRVEHFGEVVVERLSTTTLRVKTAPVVRQEPAAVALLRVIRGSFHIERDGQRVRVVEGESVLMLSTHAYEFVLEEGEYSQVQIPLRMLTPEAIVSVLAAVDAPAPASVLSSLVWGMCDALLDTPSSDNSATEAVAEFLAVVITQLAVRDFPERPAGSGKSPLLTIALMHIEGNLGDHDLSLESLAATVGTSPRTLHREFHAIGMTPMGALRDARLAAVAQRLSSRAPLPPLDALAQEYGYSDRTALTRAFHRRFGRSPTDYRARMVPFGL